jgi:branched-chain amino acid aminotransferase
VQEEQSVNEEFKSMSNVDGRITPTGEACVPVLDRGFLYGDSIYEVFRTYSGVPLFYQQHWDRLENSARLIQMHITQGCDEITEQIRRTVAATSAGKLSKDVYVRYVITRGEGPVDLYPNPELETRYVIIVNAVPQWAPDFYSVGMKAAIPAVRRNPTDALDPNIKGGNYLNNVIAITQAREFGADESIILNRAGYVTEASNSNVFFVLDGELVTPGGAAGNLRGITKKAAREACAAKGLAVNDRNVHASDLEKTSECFVTSATREVMPIISLRLDDGRMVAYPAGGGEITRKVAQYYRQYMDEHVRQNASLSLW